MANVGLSIVTWLSTSYLLLVIICCWNITGLSIKLFRAFITLGFKVLITTDGTFITLGFKMLLQMARLLRLGPNVITDGTFITLGPNVITDGTFITVGSSYYTCAF